MEAALSANREAHRIWMEWASGERMLSMSERDVKRLTGDQG
jgi:hypothetical protein